MTLTVVQARSAARRSSATDRGPGSGGQAHDVGLAPLDDRLGVWVRDRRPRIHASAHAIGVKSWANLSTATRRSSGLRERFTRLWWLRTSSSPCAQTSNLVDSEADHARVRVVASLPAFSGLRPRDDRDAEVDRGGCSFAHPVECDEFRRAGVEAGL
jgi:hypothetical protein